MNVSDRFVIPPDVKLLDINDLPDWVRANLEFEPGDFALTRVKSRETSRVIDASAAQLLKEFQTPKTIPDAVLAYSLLTNVDPQSTLVEAFPLLQQAIFSHFLVNEDSAYAETSQPLFAAGDHINGYQVTKQLQFLEDTEVVQALAPDGRPVAVKIARSNHVSEMGSREIATLRHLDGTINPSLIEEGRVDEHPYMVLEWCGGVDILTAAQKVRGLVGETSSRELLAFTCAVLNAYVHLHRQGVLHGDIHPRNILVDETRAIKIIDFGVARMIDGSLDPSPRAGVPSFFEPEYVLAQLQNTAVPQSSVAGEVFALGALVYMILTGAAYTNFSLERETMLKQIVEDPPLPFAHWGLKAWPEVETMVAKALSKQPEDRFETVAAFAEALSHVRIEPEIERPAARSNLLMQIEWDVLARFGFENEEVVNSLTTAPTTSFNYGSSGIAYAFYRMACVKSDAQLFQLAQHWIRLALRDMNTDDSFYSPVIDMTSATVGNVSPYHTSSGVHAVHAYIAHALGDNASLQAALQNFVRAASAPCTNLDLTLGRSGGVLVAALLLDLARTVPQLDTAPLIALGDEAAQGIWSAVNQDAPVGVSQEITYLGMAHGWAGILYAALRWSQVSGSALPKDIDQRLQELAQLAEPAGQGLRWPWMQNRKGAMPGWCNGSAGYVHLWTLAHEITHDAAYIDLAQKAAWNVFESQGRNGNLCCGMAGQAYALLNLYKSTGDQDWLSRASSLAEQAAAAVIQLRGKSLDASTALDLRPESLYKGEVGVALLAADLRQPDTSAQPLFERIHWS